MNSYSTKTTFLRFALVLTSATLVSQAAPVKLIEAGKARSHIVISEKASPVEIHAAKELQAALQRATGAVLEIVSKTKSSPAEARIVIGTPENTPSISALKVFDSSNADERDQILISTQDNTLFLGGSNPRSVLFAVYRFLEESFDFRWLWPGDTGEFFRKSESYQVENLHLNEVAGIPWRSLDINAPHYDLDTLVWMARQRMNIHPTNGNFDAQMNESLRTRGFLNRYAGHNLELPENVLEAHPEYAAEFGGVRSLRVSNQGPHLCWSNPGVQEALVKLVTDWVQRRPEVDRWSFYPVDHTHFCECQKCVEMAKDVSTRFQKLSKIIIDGVHESVPEAQFSTLAYQSYRDIPQEIAPFKNIYYCTYNVSYRLPLGSKDLNDETAQNEIKQWQKLGIPVGLRGYNMIPFHPYVFVPLVDYLTQEIAFAKREGLTGYATEVTPFGHPKNPSIPPEKTNWNTNRINLYAIGRATWNPQLTAEQIVDDWTKTIYGSEAAAPMKRYYFAMEKAWRIAPGDISYFLHPPAPSARGFITKELMLNADGAFAEARQLLEKNPNANFRERALEQVTLEEKMFNQWREYYQLVSADEAHFQAVAAHSNASVEELMNPDFKGWNEAPRLPEFQTGEKSAKDSTEVSALWRDGTLYLRAVCHDSTPEQRSTKFSEHDQNIWSDDSIEMFINRANGGYWHLAVNSLGARYDAESRGGMNLDLSANPQWSAKAKVENSEWRTTIALPLKEFGIVADIGATLPISIKRTRAGGAHPNTGWPDESYHSPTSHGTIRLVQEKPKNIAIYRGAGEPEELGAALEENLRRKGWKVNILEDESSFNPKDCQVLFLRYGSGENFRLSTDFLQDHVLPWIQSGGILLVSASNEIPFLRWFGSENYNVQWGGWEISPLRESVEITEGEWLKIPNDLEPVFSKGVTPSSGFRAISPDWEVLATIRMKDESTVAYLLRARIDKGMVYLTGSNMAFAGGNEMFGNANPENAALLIENLSHTLP